MVLTVTDHGGRSEVLSYSVPGAEFVVQAAEPNLQHVHICETRPQGSTPIYKYDPATDEMVLISHSVSRSIDGDRRIA